MAESRTHSNRQVPHIATHNLGNRATPSTRERPKPSTRYSLRRASDPTRWREHRSAVMRCYRADDGRSRVMRTDARFGASGIRALGLSSVD